MQFCQSHIKALFSICLFWKQGISSYSLMVKPSLCFSAKVLAEVQQKFNVEILCQLLMSIGFLGKALLYSLLWKITVLKHTFLTYNINRVLCKWTISDHFLHVINSPGYIVRFTQFLQMYEQIGPKLITIKGMLSDLVFFVCFLFLSMISYG